MTRAPTEFVLLTGFLGSGKTTLLRDFLEGPEAADTAVIINEAGEINIDGAIIAETGRGLPVALLSSGCVCCSVSNDLLYTIEALVEGRRDAGLPPFRRIVLECSGLALPGAVLRSFGPSGPAGMPVRIVATVDARGSSLDAGFEDAAAQLAAAHTIVVTKLDQPHDGTIRDRIAGLNPFARVVETEDARERARAAFLFGDPTAEALPAALRHGGHAHPHVRVGVTLATFAAPMSWPEVQDWLEDLTGLCGARLLRLKGILRVTDCPEPILVQAVGNLFSVPRRMRLAAEPVEGLVIITRDLPLAALRASSLGRQATFSDGHARRIADRAGNGSAPLSASTRLLASAACF